MAKSSHRKVISQEKIIVHSRDHLTMSIHFTKFVIKRGLLYREIIENSENIQQLVLPACYRKTVLQGLHNAMGHPGREKTAALVTERFYWPAYTMDTNNWVDSCDICLRRKSQTKAPLVNIQSSYPLDLVSTNFLKVDECAGGV